jgi:hypothetical protein
VTAARWRCARDGSFVAGESVSLTSGGAPVGECADCDNPAAPVLFERVAPPRSRDPHDARAIGQDTSLLALPEVARAGFMAVVESLPAGQLVSVNRIRARLDGLEVPPSTRGGLFAAAVKAGLLEPVFVEAGGIRVAAREPSTGATAALASVRLYRRTDKAAAPS